MKITNKFLSLLLIFSLFVGAAGFIPQVNAVGQDEDEAYLEDNSVLIEEDNESDAYEELEELMMDEDSVEISSSNKSPVITTFMNKDMGGGNGYPAGGGGIGIGKVRPTPKPKPTPRSKLPAKGFKSGAAGEKFLNDYVGGIGHKVYKNVRVYDHKKGKWVKEKRIVDAYVPKTRVAHESKVGYTSLSNFVRKQIDKDAALRKAGQVDGVKWHFFKSAKTGKIGATKNLREYLKKKKVPYQYHD
ncbi:hypothetical protein ABE009_05885 [Bacillus altitudinis]|nr:MULTISPECIES: hypothetical protein [Bacillus]AKC65606.1 hypothetical protein VT48_06125 [Bacillus altitudinis]MCY7498265.1 hypothetical protein [Bacillus altitudinis]MCY7535482.1 hypothetical protein [Bacillus altitudinis]MCY7545499.1 hypothetical protein [Bacillus altitudinis]MCY7553599.1 hypothetical protein [Bacillus altitudinis]